VPLAGAVDDEHAEAKYRSGVLIVTLPKTGRPSTRRITVSSH
jgi:HSP20 family molecular chaperone IbpA